MPCIMRFLAFFLGTALSLSAQTNPGTATNAAAAVVPRSRSERIEQIHSECVQGRRLICGKILKILPDGLVVDSGYTNLTHPPLSASWLVPGRVSAGRPANQIEGRDRSPSASAPFSSPTCRRRAAPPQAQAV